MGWNLTRRADTGRRNVRDDLVNPETISAGGRAWIQRSGDRVHLSLYDIAFTDSGTVRVLTVLPVGFRPIEREGYTLSISSTRNVEAIVMPTGLYLYAVPLDGGRVRATISMVHGRSLPDDAPGGEALMAWKKRVPRDTGTLTLTPTFPQVTNGNIWIRRVAEAVHVTFYDVEFATSSPPEFFYLQGLLPIGYRPSVNTSFAALADVNGTVTRRIRFQANGQVLLYDITPQSRINVTASYLTPDPMPAGGA